MKDIFRKINRLEAGRVSGGTSIFALPEPSVVRFDRHGFDLVEGLKKKSEVFPGMRIATFIAEGVGDLFSPIHGVVSNLTDTMIELTRTSEIIGTPPPKWFPKLEKLTNAGLVPGLNRLGVTTENFIAYCSTMIISAVDPDPVLTWSEALLAREKTVLDAGFALLKRLSSAKDFVFAAPADCTADFEGARKVKIYDTAYPAGMDELLIATVTGIEAPAGYRVVHLHDLWRLGRVALTGEPLLETVLTVGNTKHANHLRVAIGTPMCDVLYAAGIELDSGVALLRNGILRGNMISATAMGISETTTGLSVRPNGARISFGGDGPCVNCGACVEVCPARLDPGRLSRFAEMGMVEDCQKEFIQVCFECGLCTYVCTARRPVLQYLRMMKRRLSCSLPERRIQNVNEE